MSGPVCVRFTRLDHARDLEPPTPATADAAGADVCAAVDEDVIIEPGGRALIPTGFKLAIPKGFEGQVRPRSGLALRDGLMVPNAPGTIDADYRGELKVILLNAGDAPFVVRRGDRVAQLVIAPVPIVRFEEVDDLDETPRGEGGFGHTGS